MVSGLRQPVGIREVATTTRHQVSHPEAKLDEDRRARNARAIQLINEWLADESGYDEKVFPLLKSELEADRLSYRRRFKE
jgi:hypothetical protein